MSKGNQRHVVPEVVPESRIALESACLKVQVLAGARPRDDQALVGLGVDDRLGSRRPFTGDGIKVESIVFHARHLIQLVPGRRSRALAPPGDPPRI